MGADKCLSLSEIRMLGSLENAERYVVDLKVEELLRGGLEAWLKYLRTERKLNMSYLDDSLPRLRELFQRRNLLVHNGGVVNRLYLNQVDESLRQGVAVGQSLATSVEYVSSSIDMIEVSFLLICAELWKRLAKDDEDRSATLTEIAYEHLVHENWAVAESLSRFASQDTGAAEHTRLVGQINHMQSLKWQGREQELNDMLTTVDYRAKEPVFRLCLMALRDEVDELVDILPKAIERENLQLEHLREWPIFREVRKHPLYLASLDAERLESQNGSRTDEETEAEMTP